MLYLRVDDCGWNEKKEPDKKLKFFQRWRKALFANGQFPVTHGFIPAMLGEWEQKWLEDNIDVAKGERVAVHGWTHRKGETITVDLMRRARAKLRMTDVYIPPFNNYSPITIEVWMKSGGTIFMGGFNEQDHSLGVKPAWYCNTLHLSAYRPYYDKIGPVLAALRKRHREEGDEYEYPHCVTLHCTWDRNHLKLLQGLAEFEWKGIDEIYSSECDLVVE